MKKHFFYLARCHDGSLYSGYTIDVKAREETHNCGKGAKYTRARLPVSIVYFEEFESRSDAMKREAEVKKWSKTRKEALIG